MKVNIRQYLNFNYGNYTIRKQAVKILTLLSPVNVMMQEKSCNVALATELITNAASEISLMKSKGNWRFLVLKLASPVTKADRVAYNRNGREYRAICWLVVSWVRRWEWGGMAHQLVNGIRSAKHALVSSTLLLEKWAPDLEKLTSHCSCLSDLLSHLQLNFSKPTLTEVPHVFHMWIPCGFVWSTCGTHGKTCVSHVLSEIHMKIHVKHMWTPQIPHVNHMWRIMWFTCGICGAHMCSTCVFMCISDKTCETHVFPCVPHVLHTRPHGIHMWNTWGTSVREGPGHVPCSRAWRTVQFVKVGWTPPSTTSCPWRPWGPKYAKIWSKL